ncbi:MAG: metal-sensitive transcriptional regulator [Paenibacillus macerans]|uniref:Metal-sensitive transcriptional repressor family protein n=1 Tax=Paenibacillus macerans TaxID=44252 RepID=A0A090ZMK8_PAEMA|nr:metal-sensitive transcriptional regulator [Paenibacillus macerans]KFN11633.1 metal-sensitive transcriptional repressor family protein [Paenibacillus macerans]MDU7474211.1 metal-sensitive transcriptional regulator [Paenibacillus macerans]MEC0140588.1 metal-sensitive transcriptional regulator [Paenibacillus macerans]MEC0154102.1 metal-sensitive transcriptional regulator [Paenibacillus macerans]SUA86003.1 copper-sensing transcriptional repressor csoR [Paenibacillus macerans]
MADNVQEHTHHCEDHGVQNEGKAEGKTAGKTVRRSHHSEALKSNLTSRLNRIEGQIRGIKGLIERDTYCDDVLNQIAAVQSALNSVGRLLLEGHMRSCVIERIQAGETEVVDELLVTVNKLMK